MFTIKHELADGFGTHLTSAPERLKITRRDEAGFSAALRDSPKADTAKAVIHFSDISGGLNSVVVDKADKCWVMNASGKTVASL